MPVAKTTEGPARRPSGSDLTHRRGPNDGTVWAGTEEDKDPARFDSGDTSNPNRFTQWSDGTKKGVPGHRPVDEVLALSTWKCDACKLEFLTMELFNEHCTPDKRGNGKEMRCEVDKRLFIEKNAEEKAHMTDPNAVANAVAEALKPTLLSIVDAFDRVNKSLEKLSRGEKPKKEKKSGGRPRVVRGAAPARRAEPPGSVESEKQPVADPPAEPPPAE